MNIISLKEAQPGMVLARPVEDALGRVLINAGERLTEDLIRVLMRRGFSEVEIHPDSARRETRRQTKPIEAEAVYEIELSKLMESFKKRFLRVAISDQVAQCIMRVSLRVLVDDLSARLQPSNGS